ncbi:MAG: tRNA (adenosine(37)-N6)-threonylcarbamoyltransferase complex dimerization subunit type 1 TsaB [Bacteroidales bacterium]|nr:tRNA (adenosine(37)-N6)-threonylcarbamoyltransferase complex dimerization subunit type 1 TsaB [Bacteroidales bacterium]MBQ2452034.1 tRNA (adenosine(37)-N6)-threonylcarbamoyltransferase complex dimerization subunit type 1 TsaB [Bacteroidales bacterium]
MSRILLIETSAALCSVALCEEGKCVAYKESQTERSHASMTAVLIDELLKERNLRVQDCDGVAVSKGPGSYTGLRVGVSSAKGLCFGAGLPLLAVGTLDVLVEGAWTRGEIPAGCEGIFPVIDARRNEIYTAAYSVKSERTGEIRPLIIGEDTFDIDINGKKLLFIGDAAEKCQRLLSEQGVDISRCTFINCQPKACDMCQAAQAAFDAQRFEDVAYFEPFYLKEFVATVSKKKLF